MGHVYDWIWESNRDPLLEPKNWGKNQPGEEPDQKCAVVERADQGWNSVRCGDTTMLTVYSPLCQDLKTE